jgi:hypothetical protein
MRVGLTCASFIKYTGITSTCVLQSRFTKVTSLLNQGQYFYFIKWNRRVRLFAKMDRLTSDVNAVFSRSNELQDFRGHNGVTMMSQCHNLTYLVYSPTVGAGLFFAYLNLVCVTVSHCVPVWNMSWVTHMWHVHMLHISLTYVDCNLMCYRMPNMNGFQ